MIEEIRAVPFNFLLNRRDDRDDGYRECVNETRRRRSCYSQLPWNIQSHATYFYLFFMGVQKYKRRIRGNLLWQFSLLSLEENQIRPLICQHHGLVNNKIQSVAHVLIACPSVYSLCSIHLKDYTSGSFRKITTQNDTVHFL